MCVLGILKSHNSVKRIHITPAGNNSIKKRNEKGEGCSPLNILFKFIHQKY